MAAKYLDPPTAPELAVHEPGTTPETQCDPNYAAVIMTLTPERVAELMEAK